MDTRRVKQWKASPLIFIQDVFDFVPSEQQIELFTTAPNHKRTTIRSGHGTGKDASVSIYIWWFLCTRPYAKVVCTAPTSRQLQDVLWSELSKWYRKSKIGDEFVIQRDKIFQKDAPKEWWCRGVSPSVKASKEEQAETLAGFHGDHLLIVVDEASGVTDPVFVPLEGAMTQKDNSVVLIGNMTKNKGYFYDSHFHKDVKKNWNKLHWNSENSSLVSRDMIEYFKVKYGEDSDAYRVRVLGDPPSFDDDTLIPFSWASQCVGKEVGIASEEPLYLGVDVARFGSDSSVILPREGLKIYEGTEHQGLDVIEVAATVSIEYQEREAWGAAIDVIGIGAGVYDWLRRKDLPGLYGVNVSEKSTDIARYHRLRDELWVMVRENCRNGLYSFPDSKFGNELVDELSSVKYSFNNHGGYVVESKKDMKLRGVMSPNKADALCLSEYFSNVAHRVFKNNKKKQNYRSQHSSAGVYSWMAV